jgi:hypothetical protein
MEFHTEVPSNSDGNVRIRAKKPQELQARYKTHLARSQGFGCGRVGAVTDYAAQPKNLAWFNRPECQAVTFRRVGRQFGFACTEDKKATRLLSLDEENSPFGEECALSYGIERRKSPVRKLTE